LIGDAIRSARTALGWTQQELGNCAGDFRQTEISAIERGQVEAIVIALRTVLLDRVNTAFEAGRPDDAQEASAALADLLKALPAKPSQLRKAVQL
jgi:transcriptional regulator with XRE-family HTH domain